MVDPISKAVEPPWWSDQGLFQAFGYHGKFLIGSCAYLGGWSDYAKPHGSAFLEVEAEGLRYSTSKTLFVIPWDRVAAITITGPDQAEKQTTGRQLLLLPVLGVLSLFMKEKVKTAALAVALKSGEDVRFETHDFLASELRTQLAPVLLHLPSPNTAPPTPTTTRAPGGVADELRKFAELRDAGILTEAEFQAKKTELLGRI